MWTLTILVRGQVERMMLQYLAIERATTAMKTLTDDAQHDAVSVKDDFGRAIVTSPRVVDIVLMQDVDRALEGNRMAELRQARSQAHLQKMVMEDPTVAGMARQQAIINGGMPGGLVRGNG